MIEKPCEIKQISGKKWGARPPLPPPPAPTGLPVLPVYWNIGGFSALVVQSSDESRVHTYGI